jgi:hypothetical protein
MNKKILPLFSFLLMFALALASFAPAYAAPSVPPGSNSIIRYEPPVKLLVTYNAATSQILLTASFVDNSLIKRGDVSVSSIKPIRAPWVKTATFYNTNQITLKYSIPRNSVGVYCANVTLISDKMRIMPVTPGMNPASTMTPGTASKCIVLPLSLQK